MWIVCTAYTVLSMKVNNSFLLSKKNEADFNKNCLVRFTEDLL